MSRNSAVVIGNGARGKSQADFFKSGNQFNEDTPQAHIGVNTAVVHKFLSHRKGHNGLPSDRRLAAVTDNNDLHVIPGEVVFMANSRSYYNYPRSYPGDSRPRAFTSFNSEVIPKGATQEEFNAGFKILGFAITDYAFGENSQTQSGFTTRVGGSGTTINNGSKRFLPGDLIVARIPSIRRAQRKTDDKARPVVRGIPRGKQTAILEPLSFKEYYNAYMKDPVEWFMTEADEAAMDFNRLNRFSSSGLYSNLNLEQETALLLDRFITQVAVATVSSLEASGLITYTDPTGGGDGGGWRTNPAAYAKLPDTVLKKNSASMLANRKVVIEGDATIVINTFNPASLQTLKTQRTNQLGYIAALLGALPPNPNAPHIKPSQELKQSIFGRAMWPLLPTLEDMNGLSIGHYLVGKSLKRRRNNIGNIAGLEQITEALLTLQSEGAKDLTKGTAVAKAAVDSTIVATTRNTSATGEELDYYR